MDSRFVVVKFGISRIVVCRLLLCFLLQTSYLQRAFDISKKLLRRFYYRPEF